MAEIGTTLTSTRCKLCGTITFVSGYNKCEDCLSKDAAGIDTHYMPLSAIADVIVTMDQLALDDADRLAYFMHYHIEPEAVEAAQEEVEGRYKAANMRRNRSRRW